MNKQLKRLTMILLFITMMFTMTLLVSKNQNMQVEAAYTYTENTTEFRSAWVSYYTGDISYTSETEYRKAVDDILDTLEYYNMNAIIFHVRANHDAWYNSKINKINSQLSSVDFDEFDPLEYIITESHKRGIEFHAWMNPYRIGSTYDTKENVASAFKNFPDNPASNVDNVLIGNPLEILDPGRPEVRDFLVDTCLELVENYNVDAIHFDDYFYASGIDDTATRNLYNKSGETISNFRREQVDTFIYNLKVALDEFNEENNRYVQLGIAPTGVYQNASNETEANTPLSEYVYNSNGNLTYPRGATIGCQNHYESYLYCDTLKWVNNEWIDYIIPQTYWSTTHSRAPFEKLINWWNMAVKNKDVNLYSGMGIYMWLTQTNQAYTHLAITSNLENVLGTSIYSYEEVRNAYTSDDAYAKVQMSKVKSSAWKNLSILPGVKSFESVKPGAVTDLIVEDNTVSFSAVDDAKFYIIYRDEEMIDYSNEQIVAIVGGDQEYLVWTDSEDGEYTYDVVPLSYTNTLGEPTIKLVEDSTPIVTAQISTSSDGETKLPVARAYNLEVGTSAYVFLGEDAPDESRLKYNWSSSNEEVATISSYGTISALTEGTVKITGTYQDDPTKYCDFYINVYSGDISNRSYTVKFIDTDGTVLKTETVPFGGAATPPTDMEKDPTQKYYLTFAGWSAIYSNITSDMEIQAIYNTQLRTYTVTYQNPDGEVLKVEEVKYGYSGTPPTNPKMKPTVEYSYHFVEWDKDYTSITENIVITGVYSSSYNLYELAYQTNGGNRITPDYYYHSDNAYPASTPTKEGYVFVGWYMDEEFQTPCVFPMNLTQDTTIYAKWAVQYQVNYHNNEGILIDSIRINEGETLSSYVAPTIQGLVFVGWATSQNGTDIFDLSTPINQDYNLYPVYKNEYTVNFYNHKGEIILTVTVEENTAVTAPEAEEREGYTFVGWDKDLTNITSNMDVHAVYEEIEDNDDKAKNCSCSNGTIVLINSIALLATAILFFRKKIR